MARDVHPPSMQQRLPNLDGRYRQAPPMYIHSRDEGEPVTHFTEHHPTKPIKVTYTTTRTVRKTEESPEGYRRTESMETRHAPRGGGAGLGNFYPNTSRIPPWQGSLKDTDSHARRSDYADDPKCWALVPHQPQHRHVPQPGPAAFKRPAPHHPEPVGQHRPASQPTPVRKTSSQNNPSKRWTSKGDQRYKTVSNVPHQYYLQFSEHRDEFGEELPGSQQPPTTYTDPKTQGGGGHLHDRAHHSRGRGVSKPVSRSASMPAQTSHQPYWAKQRNDKGSNMFTKRKDRVDEFIVDDEKVALREGRRVYNNTPPLIMEYHPPDPMHQFNRATSAPPRRSEPVRGVYNNTPPLVMEYHPPDPMHNFNRAASRRSEPAPSRRGVTQRPPQQKPQHHHQNQQQQQHLQQQQQHHQAQQQQQQPQHHRRPGSQQHRATAPTEVQFRPVELPISPADSRGTTKVTPWDAAAGSPCGSVAAAFGRTNKTEVARKVNEAANVKKQFSPPATTRRYSFDMTTTKYATMPRVGSGSHHTSRGTDFNPRPKKWQSAFGDVDPELMGSPPTSPKLLPPNTELPNYNTRAREWFSSNEDIHPGHAATDDEIGTSRAPRRVPQGQNFNRRTQGWTSAADALPDDKNFVYDVNTDNLKRQWERMSWHR